MDQVPSEFPAQWGISDEKLTILLAPQGSEFPPGFPFKKTVTDFRGALQLILAAEPGSVEVLCVPESAVEYLLTLRTPLEYSALALVGGDIQTLGLWSLMVAPLQEISIQEIMKYREATPQFTKSGTPPALEKDDFKTFSRDLPALRKQEDVWSQSASEEESAD